MSRMENVSYAKEIVFFCLKSGGKGSGLADVAMNAPGVIPGFFCRDYWQPCVESRSNK
jgi:hypothetical protein